MESTITRRSINIQIIKQSYYSFICAFFIIELPILSNPPNIAKEGPGVREVVITWLPWSKANGDVGEPPILWYSIWLNTLGLGREEKAGIVTHFNCGKECNFTIEELEPNTDYGVRISTRRDGEGGEGIPGPVRKFRTLCAGELVASF